AGLPLQIHTTIIRYNRDRRKELGALLLSLPGVVMWSLFFLVPTGRARVEDLVMAEEFESIFNWLYDFSRRAPFDVRTTAAQHYRRVVLQRRAEERRQNPPELRQQAGESTVRRDIGFSTQSDRIGRAPKGVNDGNGFVFITHTGEV